MTHTLQTLAPFFFASHPQASPETAHELLLRFQKESNIDPDWHTLTAYYLHHYDNYGLFPDIKNTITVYPVLNIQTPESLDLKLLQHYSDTLITTLYTDRLADKLKETSVLSRNQILSEMLSVLKPIETAETKLPNTQDFTTLSLIQPKDLDIRKPLWSLDHLNKIAPLSDGMLISVLGMPGSYKTTFALNQAFINILPPRSFNCLYLYGENTSASYQMLVRSRFSRQYLPESPVAASALKAGVDPNDTASSDLLRKLEAEWNKLSDKGIIHFLSFGDVPKDPVKLGMFLAHQVIKYNIKFLIVDHLTAFQSFKPSSSSLVEYLNAISGALRFLSVGTFNSPPIITFVLTQINRETQKTAMKKAIITPASAYSASGLEMDSFIMLALTQSQDDKDSRQLKYQVIKNRDGEVMNDPLQTTIDPVYSVIDDVYQVVTPVSDVLTTAGMDQTWFTI